MRTDDKKCKYIQKQFNVHFIAYFHCTTPDEPSNVYHKHILWHSKFAKYKDRIKNGLET